MSFPSDPISQMMMQSALRRKFEDDELKLLNHHSRIKHSDFHYHAYITFDFDMLDPFVHRIKHRDFRIASTYCGRDPFSRENPGTAHSKRPTNKRTCLTCKKGFKADHS